MISESFYFSPIQLIMKHFYFILAFVLPISLLSQFGVRLNTAEAFNGYMLVESFPSNYLIDNCGEIVNQWNVAGTDNHVKLLPNGNILYIRNNEIVEKNWNDITVKSWVNTRVDLLLEYEVISMPSGNWLALVRKSFSSAEFTEAGYDLSSGFPTQVDGVIEVDPATGEIVWEWYIIDHVIQERSAALNNYGVVADNPQLLNMDAISDFDWNFQESFMINGFDYNPSLDQIVLSVRKMSEIVIIDHSTTTEEAAGHTGGISGKGGDIIYRWGNPQNYGRGDASDRYLFFQHNPNWITEGEHEGKIICYNNGLDRPGSDYYNNYSQVPIINTPLTDIGDYTLIDGSAFAPLEPTVEYSRIASNTEFYSSYTSGAEMLPNSNVYITEGASGRLFEVNPEGDIVWEYNLVNANYIFRSEKYAPNYPGLQGVDLTPSGNTIESFGGIDCNILSAADDLFLSQDEFEIRTIDQITNIEHKEGKRFSISMFNFMGQIKYMSNNYSDLHTIDLSKDVQGVYVLRLIMEDSNKQASFKISSF